MPPEPDHTELLEQIITEGDRRKRRRLLAGGGVVTAVVVLLAGVALAWPGSDRDEVTVADDPTTTTTSEPDTTTTSTTAAPSTTTTTVTGPSTCSVADIARDLAIDVGRVGDLRDCIDRWALVNICLESGDCPEGYSIVGLEDGRWLLLGQTLQTCVEELTGVGIPRSTADRFEGYFECFPEPPLVCRNSTDQRCGEFYWDYDPATFPNAPLEVSLASQPTTIVAGEPVTFEITLSDADAIASHGCGSADFAGATEVASEGYSQPTSTYIAWVCPSVACTHGTNLMRFGPWDPPAPPVTEPDRVSVTARYAEPGSYSVWLSFSSANTCLGNNGGFGSRFLAYDSRATVTFTIEVLPA